MKICTHHWAMCRKAIDDRGLTPLVGTGQAAMERAVEEIEGRPTEDATYDPLMALNYMLMGRAIEVMGLSAMVTDMERYADNDGEVCPLCEPRRIFDLHLGKTCGDPQCTLSAIPTGTKPYDEDFIDGASDSILQHCRERWLVAGVQ